MAGGDSLAKLRAGQAATIVNVRRFAPAAPGVLAETIAACARSEPAERPGSMAQLAENARPACTTRGTRWRGVGRCNVRQARTTPMAAEQAANRASRRMAVAALALMAVVALAWPLWQRWHRGDTSAGRDRGVAAKGEHIPPEGDSPIFVGRKLGQSPGRKLGQSPDRLTPSTAWR